MIPNESRRVIGLDCHPDSFTAAIVVGTNARDARTEKVTDQLPLERFEGWLTGNCRSDDVLVMEASGNSFGLCDRAAKAGFDVIVLESKQVAGQCQEDWSNDRRSAVLIARVFLSGMINDSVWVPDHRTRQRREVLGSYQESVTDSTRSINRIKSFLNEHTVRLPHGMKLTSAKAQGRVLQRTRSWTESQRLILQEAFEDLNRAQRKQKTLLGHMAEDIASDVTLLSLMRIHGIGVITTYALAATIGTIHRFKNAKKLVSYFGLAPRRKESGSTDQPVKSKQKGKKSIRALLIECAHTAFKSQSSRLHRWAWRLAMRKGHTFGGDHKDTRGKKVAAIAVARKIVTAVWYHLNGLPFQVEEATSNLVYKLARLAGHIGKERVRAQGYATYKEFTLKKLEFIANGA